MADLIAFLRLLFQLEQVAIPDFHPLRNVDNFVVLTFLLAFGITLRRLEALFNLILFGIDEENWVIQLIKLLSPLFSLLTDSDYSLRMP